MSAADVVIEDERWEDAGLEALAGQAADAALAHLGRPGASIVVLGCDDARIAALNGQFRGKDRPTNVLSWPAVAPPARAPGTVPVPPPAGEWGDIALAWETCSVEAAAAGKPLRDHVLHLIVHGTLHLAGYDHDDDADAETMQAAERSILAGLGVADPYDDARHET